MAAFLEDQDFFRFFGIFRNVTLKAIPDVHLEDVWFKPVLNQDNESGSVSVSMKVSVTDSQNVTAVFILKDREENILVEKSLPTGLYCASENIPSSAPVASILYAPLWYSFPSHGYIVLM